MSSINKVDDLKRFISPDALNRIEKIPKFVDMINNFTDNGGIFGISAAGGAYYRDANLITLNPASTDGFRLLAHELGHAFGVNQQWDVPMSAYPDARSYGYAI